MTVTILHRRGTAAQWTAANPTLANGEPGYETDTGREKIGDGTTRWASLPYKPLLIDADATHTPRVTAVAGRYGMARQTVMFGYDAHGTCWFDPAGLTVGVSGIVAHASVIPTLDGGFAAIQNGT